jgi:hypothetical protein
VTPSRSIVAVYEDEFDQMVELMAAGQGAVSFLR